MTFDLTHFDPSPAYLIMAMAWLEAPKEEIVVGGNPADFFGEALPEDCADELWRLPDGVVVELDCGDVDVCKEGGGFTYGNIRFCTFNGHRFIAEQCASPYLIHWRGK